MRSDDQARILELGELCTQEDPPLCNAECPFHVDMRGVCAAAAAGDFKKGRALLEQVLSLPRLMSRLCEAPCSGACKYGELGDQIQTRQIADACMRFGAETKKRLFLPKRTQKALVLGGGLGGLMAAVELGRKGFFVHVMYDTATPAGDLQQLIPDVLPQEALDEDLKQLDKLHVSFEQVETAKLDPQLYLEDEAYQSIYVSDALYRTLAKQGVKLDSHPLLRQTQLPKVFCRGEDALHPSFVEEAFCAKQAALSMDRYMQGVKMDQGRESEGPLPTRLYTSLEGVEPRPAVKPAAGMEYTEEEAKEEAARCLNCQCLECVKGCAFMQHYNKYPKLFINEFHNTLNFTLANRMHNIVINSCAECGQCKVICPNDCDMKEVTECSRRIMVEDNKMPPIAHEFALVDMQFSNSEEFFTVRHQPGHDSSKYAFFPGCQLAATAPNTLRAAYEDLSARLDGGVGLILGCCGAIGEWAQRNDLFEEEQKKIINAWEILGKPELITACPTCYHIFKKYTQIPVTGIWQLMCQIGLPETAQKGSGVLAIHDSCGARNYKEIQDCVRELASQMGYEVEEPKFKGESNPCCGFGGLTAFANREVGNEMAAFAANQCDQQSLTYCANCRDRFAAQDRPTVHVLELLYGTKGEAHGTGISLRRKNRISLRADLLRDLWKEEVAVAEPNFKLIIPDEVKAIMEDRMILESDLVQVFQKAEADNSFILDLETNLLMASQRIGNVTFWAVCRKTDEGYVLENAYSYRMTYKEL